MITCNKAIIAGNLTRDIQLKYAATGSAVASFTLAVNRAVKQPDGSWKDEADFVPIVAFGKDAENCQRFLTKGDLTLVEGRINTRSYETQTGEKRYVTEVIADRVRFPSRKDSVRGQTAAAPAQNPAAPMNAPSRSYRPAAQTGRGGWPPADSPAPAQSNTRANFEPEEADIPF